jgi:hypothetical protein
MGELQDKINKLSEEEEKLQEMIRTEQRKLQERSIRAIKNNLRIKG